MNHSKLVEMMKVITKEKFLTEASHGARYGKNVGGLSANLQTRYKQKYKVPQLAQEEEQEEDSSQKTEKGLTLTKQRPNKIDVDPKYNETHIKPIQGPKV